MYLEVLVTSFKKNLKKLLESFTLLFVIVGYAILKRTAAFHANRVFIVVHAAAS